MSSQLANAIQDEDADRIEREIIMSPQGLLAWFEAYAHIRTKERKIIQPQANPYQVRCAEAVAYCLEHDLPIRLIKLKPRQKGSSTFSTAELYWLSRNYPINSRIIGGQYDQVANLWEILQLYHGHDQFNWPNTGIVQTRSASWSNGSQCKWETAGDREAGRSGTLQAVVATEAARWREEGAANATDVITGIMNCVPDLPKTLVILESTAAGDFGMFYDYWQDALYLEEIQAGNIGANWNGFIRIFSPWFEHSDSYHELPRHIEETLPSTYDERERNMVAAYGLRPGHISWYRKTLRTECKRDPSIMMREYPCTPEEAFHASSNRRFNSAGLTILESEARQSRPDCGFFHRDGDPENNPVYAFMPCPEDSATCYIAEPPAVGHRYLIAVDIATGASQNDSQDPDRHAALVIRDGFLHPDKGWQRPKVAAWTPEKCMWDIDILADVVHSMSRHYGDALIVPEANNDRGLILLLKQRGANLYERMHDDEQPAGARSPRKTGKYGVLTTGGQGENTRNWMIETLARRIREWDTMGDGIEIPDLATVQELKTFIVRKNGRAEAADGKHDDRVMALAIGVTMLPLATRLEVKSGPRMVPADLREEMGGGGSGNMAFS